MAIIIMNLLIGLTITSIEALIQEGAKMKVLDRIIHCTEHSQLDSIAEKYFNRTKKPFMETFESSSEKVHIQMKKKVKVDMYES